jgi:hypothetical protein
MEALLSLLFSGVGKREKRREKKEREEGFTMDLHGTPW